MTTTPLTVDTLTADDRARRQAARMTGPTKAQIARARTLHARYLADMDAALVSGNRSRYIAIADLAWDLEDEYAPYGVTFAGA